MTNYSLKQTMIASVVAAGLVLAPLPGLQPGHAAAATAQTLSVQVYVDGQKLALTPSPIVQQGTTLVPMRAIFNALGAEVTWNQQTKTVMATKDGDSISLKIGSASAVLNGTTVKLQVPAQQKSGSTLVPLRFVSEALGATVAVNGNTIQITSAQGQTEEENDSTIVDTRTKLDTQQIVAKNDEKVVMISTDTAQGSGVVVGGSLILTNLHVVSDASAASVTLNDGTVLQVKGIVGFSEENDLAIIQTTKAIGVSPVTLASADDIMKGDHVVSIGSPLGVQNTAADGLISNIDGNYLQTSVPIDHGSSGGALFNEYGDLVGITTSKIEDTSADLNFAISVESVLALLQQISLNPPATVAFAGGAQQVSLANATTDEIKQYFETNYGEISTTKGTTELKQLEVKRDSDGWLVVSAVIDSSFYMLYGNKTADELRYWAITAGNDLRSAIPNQTIQLVVYYQQDFNFKPRGFEEDEVTDLGNGKWRVRYPVIDLQENDKIYVSVRT
ncbi:S1-C subfamily serine protease [Paenibacillus phyllosphaerae]|uniref:S1-C subfamily serine protease n=1 Tax=Paenibacillus phyllosphaerae TaxID=274593 RepID=A0A7W5AV26_9BACL|nr:stalk domain-containing protein [Paenibacillus phyllosphaerae]MBB3108711.1 S1-C subfamily serine protease [Paenibacillus phyllosphaerae]